MANAKTQKNAGKASPGTASGSAAKDVKDTIQESIILKMREEESTQHETHQINDTEWDDALSKRAIRKAASSKEVNFFLRQMSVLLSSGVPLMRALKVLSNRIRNNDFRLAVLRVMEEVERGTQFWSALADHPKYFNAMAVNVIHMGEESGNLVSAMKYLASYRDREAEMVRSVSRAVTYPLFLLILAIGLVFVLITMVIPIFAQQFETANVALPWPTRFVFGLSQTLTNFWLVFFVVAGLGYLAYRKFDLSRGIGPIWDRAKLRLPIFGRILVNIYTVQFATMMSLLLKSGLPLLKTLDLLRATMANSLFKKAFAHVRVNVEKGRTLSSSLNDVHVFPPIVLDMIAVGEEAGSLPEVLDQVADNYQKDVDHDSAVIGTLLEPIMIVSLGLIIGFIAVSMFLPYFKMVQFIGN